jgi:hypothetical protein
MHASAHACSRVARSRPRSAHAVTAAEEADEADESGEGGSETAALAALALAASGERGAPFAGAPVGGPAARAPQPRGNAAVLARASVA